MSDAETTPLASPSRKPIAITAVQKQALIDNLQLEGKIFQNGMDEMASF
jgi:hypothetical protein